MKHEQSRPTVSTALAIAALAMACGPVEPNLVQRESALRSKNGVSLNGVSLNGVSLNGVSLNGVSLNGVSLNGVSLNGVSLNGVSLNGSELNAGSGKTARKGSQMVGAIFNGTLSGGSTLRLRLDGYRSASNYGSTIAYYKVSYETTTGWAWLCPTSPYESVALTGRWDYSVGTATGGSWINDPSTITFGCTSTALGKCADIGLRPWATVASTSLRPFHQSCTRLIRADYCGDGTPYTIDGTTINLYDALGLQTDTESFGFEAEWLESGASCISSIHATRLGNVLPQCAKSKVVSGCGAQGWKTGVRLMSEVQ